MRVKTAILAQKKILDEGKWSYGGKVPRSAFFLAKSKQYHFGPQYRWRVLRCEADGQYYRVLVAYSMRKVQYYARLAIEVGEDLRHITSYEFHITHGGWHIHSGCGEVEHIPVGRPKGDWCKRLPKSGQERRIDFEVTDDNALELACQVFRIVDLEQQRERAGQISLL